MNVPAVILAAGASRRMGQPKQLALLDNETLLERTAKLCKEGGLHPIIVVLGASAEAILGQVSLIDVMVVMNETWNEGMASSIRVGVSVLPPNVQGCVILTCDMPAVTAEHLNKLARCTELTASSYTQRRGVPAYFPKALFGKLLGLQGDMGARGLLAEGQEIALAGGGLDIDTPKDLEYANSLSSSGDVPS
jgi:molybdenum cofactor cytidylyltransferase